MKFDKYVCLECSKSDDDQHIFFVKQHINVNGCPKSNHQDIFLKRVGEKDIEL